MSKRSQCNAPGFTIIELMVVIVVASILMAVGTPLTSTWLRQRGVREAADRLTADLQRAKLLAIERDTSCSVTLNTPNVNQYTISLINEVVDLGSYRGGVTFTNIPEVSDPVITFTPQGLCTPWGAFLVTNLENSAIYRVRATIAGGISQHRRIGGIWN